MCLTHLHLFLIRIPISDVSLLGTDASGKVQHSSEKEIPFMFCGVFFFSSFSFLQKFLIQFSLFNTLHSFHLTSGLKFLAPTELVQSKPSLVYKYQSNRHLTAAYNKQLLVLKPVQYRLCYGANHPLLLFEAVRGSGTAQRMLMCVGGEVRATFSSRTGCSSSSTGFAPVGRVPVTGAH